MYSSFFKIQDCMCAMGLFSCISNVEHSKHPDNSAHAAQPTKGPWEGRLLRWKEMSYDFDMEKM